MLRRVLIASIMLSAALASATSFAGAPLVVSVWGGNWKDTIERVVAKPYTAQTGIPVEFEVGGTLDRLAKARVAKGAPLVDVTLTTSHVARLYASDGLLEKLDLAKLPASKDLAREAFRSEHAIGGWAYVYTIAEPTDKPGILGIDVATVMAGSQKTRNAYEFVNLLLSKDVQEQLAAGFKAGPTNTKAGVPASLKGQPGVFATPAEWKERGYIIDDETRAMLLPKWKEWFNANIVAR